MMNDRNVIDHDEPQSTLTSGLNGVRGGVVTGAAGNSIRRLKCPESLRSGPVREQLSKSLVHGFRSGERLSDIRVEHHRNGAGLESLGVLAAFAFREVVLFAHII